MMYTDKFVIDLIRKRQREKLERSYVNLSERRHYVPFFVWALHARGIEDRERDWAPLPQKEKNRLFCDYQSDMIAMGFHEWQRAEAVGASPFYNLF